MVVMDLGNYMQKLEERVERNKDKRINYSYQALGVEMEKFFGNKKCWPLFYRYKEEDLRLAFQECKKYNKPYIPYLIKVIKNKYASH